MHITPLHRRPLRLFFSSRFSYLCSFLWSAVVAITRANSRLFVSVSFFFFSVFFLMSRACMFNSRCRRHRSIYRNITQTQPLVATSPMNNERDGKATRHTGLRLDLDVPRRDGTRTLGIVAVLSCTVSPWPGHDSQSIALGLGNERRAPLPSPSFPPLFPKNPPGNHPRKEARVDRCTMKQKNKTGRALFAVQFLHSSSLCFFSSFSYFLPFLERD